MKENLVENLISVDLHVHTLASKCYKKPENIIDDEEVYIALLKKYIEKNIKIIAITDHNTIQGYKNLMEVKEKAENRIKYWSELNSEESVKQQIDLEKQKLELFDKILILPGIEFEANPGIHLLLIFNPEIDIKKIEEFIVDNGYPKDIQGMDGVDVSPKSTLEIIKSANELDAITIAAHVDSNKGALNLPPGKSRAQFFRSEYLNAIQIVNLNTIDYLKNLYRSKDYKRKKLPAFIRCSDFHNDKKDIEKYVTYMMLSKLDFDSLKDILLNHTENISFTKNLENDDILKRIIYQEEAYTFQKIHESMYDELKKCICCILNDGSGTIVIGVSEDKSILAIKKTREEFEDIFNEIIRTFDKNKAFYRYNIKYYEYGNHIVPVIKFKSIKKVIYNVDGNVYFKKNNEIVLATYDDLAKIGENNYKKIFNYINDINKKRIDKINKELVKIKLLEESISLYMKIKDGSLLMRDIVDISIVDKTVKSYSEIDKLDNGSNNGNIYYIDKHPIFSEPHTQDYYIRVTCPRTSESIKTINSKKYIGESIIVYMGGVTYYIDGKEEYEIATNFPVIKIDLKEEFKSIYSLKCIVAWLKSPILLSMLELLYDSCNLFESNILNNIPIIMNDISKKNSNIEYYVNEIIKLEYNFLTPPESPLSKDEIYDSTDKHNEEVSKLAIKIDEEIKKAIDVKDNEYEVVQDFIDNKNWKKIFIKEEIKNEDKIMEFV